MAWKDLSKFRFWCNKVLPLIYDDSLSYYEVLCKVVDILNNVIEDVDYLNSEIAPLSQKVTELTNAYNRLNHTVNTSLVELNRRCTKLEDDMEDQKDALLTIIYTVRDGLQSQMNDLTLGYQSLNAWLTGLDAMIQAGDASTYLKSKKYTDDEIIKLKQQLAVNISWSVVNPFTGEVDNIQNVLDMFYEVLGYGAFTCWQFDSMGYTCEYLDSLGYTALDFDMWGRYIVLFNFDTSNVVTIDMLGEYVKREELEHYALKTDLEPYALKSQLVVYNPVNGFQNTIQQVIDTLASFHMCGNNCVTLDGLDYTATQYDAVGFTAYEFDFKGIIKTCGLYTNPVTGEKNDLQRILNDIAHIYTMNVTAKQFDDAEIDCDTWDGYDITAYEWDYYGLNIWSTLGNISVTVGLTVNDYNNLVVGQYGIVYYVPTT